MRARWLGPEEESLVLETMPSPFREIAKLAAITVMRLGELRTLRREMVHLELGIILLPRAKAGARPVVLSQEAQKLLQRQLEAHDKDWVFPGPDGAPYSRVHVSRVFRRPPAAPGSRRDGRDAQGSGGGSQREWSLRSRARRRQRP